MEKWYDFILRVKPGGKAFRSIRCSKIFFEMLANAFQIVRDYAVLSINDQVWYTNSNFDPAPWERRYRITPREDATLEERRIFIRTYMSYPTSSNRLSRDYIYSTLIEAGHEGINVEYNSSGGTTGFLFANDPGNEKVSFMMGPLKYNSFILSGVLIASLYKSAINLALGLKPLQVAVYDRIEVYTAIAIDDNFALAIDDSFATTLTTL